MALLIESCSALNALAGISIRKRGVRRNRVLRARRRPTSKILLQQNRHLVAIAISADSRFTPATDTAEECAGLPLHLGVGHRPHALDDDDGASGGNTAIPTRGDTHDLAVAFDNLVLDKQVKRGLSLLRNMRPRPVRQRRLTEGARGR